MKNKLARILVLITIATFPNSFVNAQEIEPTSPFRVTADLVSHYVWRGSMATGIPTPNFQPTLAYLKGNFEIGVWGSTDFAGSYKEVDTYVSLTAANFKFLVTDYNWNFDKANYFNYRNNETGHRLDGTIGFIGSKVMPVSITWNTMFYGFDKKTDDSTNQAYSTYIELDYTKGIARIFLGFTPWAGYYNYYEATTFDTQAVKKTFSIVNIGVSISKDLKINDAFSLPLKATLIINPSSTIPGMTI